MTTPLDDGHDPDGYGERRALESYPEFFEYPAGQPESEAPPRRRSQAAPEPPPNPAHRLPDATSGFQPPNPADRMPDSVAAAFTDAPIRSRSAAPIEPPFAGPPAPRSGRPGAPAEPSFTTPSAPISGRPGAPAEPSFTTPPAPISTPSAAELPAWSRAAAQAGPAPQQPFAPTNAYQSTGHAAELLPHQPSYPEQDHPVRTRSGAATTAERRRALPPPPPNAAPTPPTAPPQQPRIPVPAAVAQGAGRRRAKRTAASYLWPFHAFGRPDTPRSTRIRSRSTAATVWRRLKADRLAVAGGVTIVVLILLAVLAPTISGAFGVDPNRPHPELTDATFGPHGTFGGMSWAHPLGVDQRQGRDVMARLLYGARVSLLIAFGATLLSVGLGAALGMISGYVGGRVDMVIMRTADVFLAFPLMLFALGLTGALSDRAFGLSGNALRIAIMVFVMGFFNWPYLARMIRAEVLSLREREFVDAARALGATARWVIWRELVPNLVSPILVYATLLIPANIIFEAGLSALGIGLDPPTSSWGQMMMDAVQTVYTDPAYLIVPGMAVFITVLAFNLFGDGLRDALDPTAR